MSEDVKGAETETPEETTDNTLITKDQPEEKEKGPQPIYEDKEAEPDSEEGSDDDKESGDKDKGDEKESEADKGDDKGSDEEAEDYDSLDAPEDSLLSEADMERILARAKEEGLSKEAAQKYVDVAQEVLSENQKRISQAHSELSEQWVDQVKSDKEIGGEKFDESLKLAHKAISKFGTDEFIESLNETKFGNNPEVVRIFARIGKAMSPDSLVVSDSHMKTEKRMEDVFYPETNAN